MSATSTTFDKFINHFFKIFLLLLIIPTLFTVIFVGQKMNYTEWLKLDTLCPNIILFGISVIFFILLVILYKASLRVELTGKKGIITDIVIFSFFTVMYFVNCKISLEIAFMLPWDVNVVQGAAYKFYNDEPLSDATYFSVNTNNIAIVFVLGKLLKLAKIWSYDFIENIWIQSECLMFSISGFISCHIVRKITQSLLPTAGAFVASLILILASAWKMVPYTDSFGLMFTILSVLCFMNYKLSTNKPLKIVNIVLVVLFAGFGGFIKPSVYVIIIAFFVSELISFIRDFKSHWIYFLVTFVAVIFVLGGTKLSMNLVIKEVGLNYNSEISQSWQHYMMMGLNEESTGSYNSNDVSMIGQYQTDRNAKIQAEYQIIKERIAEKGFPGLFIFWLKKMVMTFNDGTFGWGCEVWIGNYYSKPIASNNIWTARLREIYWFGKYSTAYNTICQFVWIFVLLGIPGLVLKNKKYVKTFTNDTILFMIIMFIGIFLYQMLFEARARYLFVFLPVIFTMSMIGYNNYAYFITRMLKSKKFYKKMF